MFVIGQGYDAEHDEVRPVMQKMVDTLMAEGGISHTIEVLPAGRIVDQIGSQPSACSVFRRATADRLGLLWFGPVFASQDVVISRPGLDVHFQNLEDARSYRVGVVRDGSTGDRLKAMGFNPETVPASYLNLKKLESGRIDLWVTQKWIADLLIGKAGIRGLGIAYQSGAVDYGIGCNTAIPEPMRKALDGAVNLFRGRHKAGISDFF